MRSLAVSLVLLLAAAAAAQETEAPADETQSRPHIQVLSDPYALSGFYSSDGGVGLVSPRQNPYAIAGYYRSRQTAPAGAWAFAPVPRPIYWTQRRGARRHAMRPSASLFWLAPTFLAPVVPLTDPLPER
jgi:hypothetical protein